jgi:5-formyltetrahydrofolate cyclo-ligase
MLTARRQMSETARREAAHRINDETLALVRRVRPSTIAAYVPVGTEPGSLALLTALAAYGRVLLPVLLSDNDLDWAAHEGPLSAGARGLLSPSGVRLGVEAISSADLVLVPALAVDRLGQRLGRGGGSYDRALGRLSGGSSAIALLHDGEFVDAVPAEPHDRPVHGVITPGGGFALIPAPEWTK